MLSKLILKFNIIFFLLSCNCQYRYLNIKRVRTGRQGKYPIVPAYTIDYRKSFRVCKRKINIQFVLYSF
jgi:hypothetical protein